MLAPSSIWMPSLVDLDLLAVGELDQDDILVLAVVELEELPSRRLDEADVCSCGPRSCPAAGRCGSTARRAHRDSGCRRGRRRRAPRRRLRAGNRRRGPRPPSAPRSATQSVSKSSSRQGRRSLTRPSWSGSVLPVTMPVATPATQPLGFVAALGAEIGRRRSRIRLLDREAGPVARGVEAVDGLGDVDSCARISRRARPASRRVSGSKFGKAEGLALAP